MGKGERDRREEREDNAPSTRRRLGRAQLRAARPALREVGELGLGPGDGEEGEGEEGGECLHLRGCSG